MPLDIVPLGDALAKVIPSLERTGDAVDRMVAPLQGIGHILSPISMCINAVRVISTFMHDEYQPGEHAFHASADLLCELAGGSLGSAVGLTGGQFLGASVGTFMGGPMGAMIGATIGEVLGSITTSETWSELGHQAGEYLFDHFPHQAA